MITERKEPSVEAMHEEIMRHYQECTERLLPNGPSHQVMFSNRLKTILGASVAAALAAARREAAAEMRERAARWFGGRRTEDADGKSRSIAEIIRALPDALPSEEI